MTGQESMEPGAIVEAKPNSRCFACGAENEHGLQLRFRIEEDGCLAAEWRPGVGFQGFEGIVHGGVVATVLDEAMSKAVASRHWRGLTCELRVRLRRSVRAGASLTVRGWVTGKRKRKILAEASLGSGSGEWAHAWATFLEL